MFVKKIKIICSNEIMKIQLKDYHKICSHKTKMKRNFAFFMHCKWMLLKSRIFLKWFFSSTEPQLCLLFKMTVVLSDLSIPVRFCPCWVQFCFFDFCTGQHRYIFTMLLFCTMLSGARCCQKIVHMVFGSCFQTHFFLIVCTAFLCTVLSFN